MPALQAIRDQLHEKAQTLGVALDLRQTDYEGSLIDWLQEASAMKAAAVILNAGSYRQRSVAIRDAIAAIAVPVIEVRLLNARTEDTIGHPSLIAAVCDGTISGFGTTGYGLAPEAAMCLNRRPR
jgi:3-dehydroquinate dehydratase-2